MSTISISSRVRVGAAASLAVLLALPTARAQAQGAVITGKVTSEAGVALEGVNVFITELTASVGTNAQGVFTINVPSARVANQTVPLRVRAIGYIPQVKLVQVTAGTHTENFTLKVDINRLSEVVVTGTASGAGVERAKVPYAIGRVNAEDIPIPAMDPIRALQGKVAGVRIAQVGGAPGSTPAILIRGPTSIDASNGRSQGPLIVVDGIIMRNANLSELGGLDIESAEVVKGAAGATLYGSTAASGVINIKTKRGASRDGVNFTIRTEMGFSDPNSLDYGMPINHPLQTDESGKRFCLAGTGNTSPCSRTIDWMAEIMRINSVVGDTIRTQVSVQNNAPGGGDLVNLFQSNIWPTKYYNTFAQISTRALTSLSSVDASGRVGGVRFFVSGAYTSDQGAFKELTGQQNQRARVNLDYDIRSDLMVSVSSAFNKGVSDNHSVAFGSLLRGAPPGTDYLRRDTLDRSILKGGGTGFRPTGNGGGNFFYDLEASDRVGTADRYLGNVTTTYIPADWVTITGSFAYDQRTNLNSTSLIKGYRTETTSSGTNSGNMSLGNSSSESMNSSLTATLRKQLTSDFNGQLSLATLYDQVHSLNNNSSGQIFIVKDVFTLSNTSTNKTATSSEQTDKNLGFSGAATADYKDRYILEAAMRYDGSSRFGEGNRWAPFGRVSGVWRVSQEPFFNMPVVTDFRLRASRGTAGNRPGFDSQYETYSCSTTGCSLQQAGNPKLMPETTTETEIGTDMTLWNRLGIELTHVKGQTKNQILNVPTPSALGFTTQWQNAGTLENYTWELALNLPIITKKDVNWSMRGTWDRTRTYISELFMPEYFTGGGTGQGTGSFFLMTARDSVVDGFPMNRYGNIWGRKFYKSCGDLPSTVQPNCGDGKDYQVDDRGYVVWVGPGNTTKDGITKNLWQTKLPAASSPWNYALNYGHPIVDRPLKGQPGEGVGINHILGNALPDFRVTYGNNLQYKKFTLYALLDATIGHEINNQGEGWGLLDFSSGNFDQGAADVGTAKPLGYAWRAGPGEGAGTGGFYDILGPNNYNVESGSYAKLREVTLTYKVGRIAAIGGDWTIGVIGRNLKTWTKYSGYDPETGVAGGQASSGLINQTDAFDFPTLRQFTFSLSTRY